MQLPKDALKRVKLGQSFAEYDLVLAKNDVFVRTNALMAADDPTGSKCFFIGRRGTGKTAITKYLVKSPAKTALINPELFSLFEVRLGLDSLDDAKQRPFRSLVSAFRRALQIEILRDWRRHQRLYNRMLPDLIVDELDLYGGVDFDSRCLQLIALLARPLQERDDPTWLTEIKVAKKLGQEMTASYEGRPGEYTLLIDSIDDSWDGSSQAVFYLAALMHACLEMTASVPWARALVFVRENIFERVREIDTEFARLETCVVGLDWTKEQLVEMIERRLNVPFNTRLPLKETFGRFFENSEKAQELIFGYCQNRPRDVLTYCDLAVSTAQSHNHELVQLQDILDARRRFSDSRLKDLGDEYSENYPMLQVVLSRFYGLGRRWTLSGVAAFISKLLADNEVKELCSDWIFDHTSPELFVRLFYNIGFFGFTRHRGVSFRSLGPRDTSPPAVTAKTDIVIHESYWDALDLQDMIIGALDDTKEFGRTGVVSELPGGIDLTSYHERLADLSEELDTLPTGTEHAASFENIIGEIIRLCFFRSLLNVEAKVRDVNGRVIRDWIASNRASGGFWELMRHRYDATQIIWECKNYENLSASDFHQTAYYTTPQGGRLVILVFRGDVQKSHYEHVRRIATEKDGMVLLLTSKDLKVFLRQAMNGKVKEDHIQEIYDRTQREIS
ncbi:P-loop ATPase, Sll1717 family [Kribbella sp. NPDC058245]|uniref:P-loop ATPase, Sll1717 family n=1 Tax=Kribbella sp. NPDC058245 TaxID=3346399 RepID=UPI0036E816FF